MAVFVSASDETGSGTKTGTYTFGGYLLAERDWSEVFTPAWDERVLGGPPRIPYLHMTDIRSRKWREQYGLTQYEGEKRVDEALRVIRSMGAMYPVSASLPQPAFISSVAVPLKRYRRRLGPIVDSPDYLSFLWYALTAIRCASLRFNDVEKVDFVVERNGPVTEHIKTFHSELAELLRFINRDDLAGLVGELIPGGKERVPLQAADVFCWHLQRPESGKYDSIDRRRLHSLISRHGMRVEMPDETLNDLRDAWLGGLDDGA